MLKKTFIELLMHYSNNHVLINERWTEIETSYSDRKRHYHTLQHLDHVLAELTEIKSELKNQHATLFSLYYHDIVYQAWRSDNEEKSAVLAEKRMKQFLVPAGTIELCKKQILATKAHLLSADNDTNYFTDADIAVLGQPWETYSTYFKNIRKEYAIYPDMVYNPGRKKVLNRFLEMDRIFKTPYFYDKYEMRAKENLACELKFL